MTLARLDPNALASRTGRVETDEERIIAWSIVAGPREINDPIGSLDMDFPAWAYQLVREQTLRTITVVVAGGRMHSVQLADASRRAIATRGRTAVDRILDQPDPPRFIVVTSAGVQELVDHDEP